MNRTTFLLLCGFFLAGTASAQTSASAQGSASASGTSAASASKTNQPGAQASGGASAGGAASVSKDKSGAHTSGSTAASGDASANAGKNSASLANGTTMQAELSRSVDARKNKPGDPVIAKTTQDTKLDGKVVIPKGSKLVGHVTEAKERTKGESQSSLGIVFDHAVLKGGREVPVHAVIQSIAAAQSTAAVGGDDLFASGGAMGAGSTMVSGPSRAPAPRANAGAGVLGGASSTAGSAVGGVSSTAGATAGGVVNSAGATAGSTVSGATSATAGAAGTTASGALNSTSSNVAGLKGLTLDSSSATASQGSLIMSSTRNVHLDSGTQMVLRTAAQMQ